MGEAEIDIGEAPDGRAAGDARAIAWLADAASDYECIGAEAAAEFGL